MRAVLVLVGLGLALVGLEGSGARSLPWIDVALGVTTVLVGRMTRRGREPRTVAAILGVLTVFAGAAGLVTGAGAWLSLWTVAFGIAVALASRASDAPVPR